MNPYKKATAVCAAVAFSLYSADDLALGIEHRQLLQIDQVLALLRVALGQDGHLAADDAARLLDQFFQRTQGLAGGDHVPA